MNLGFKVTVPAPPKVLASGSEATCGAKFPAHVPAYCARPAGHCGGHLTARGDRYWQAEESGS